MRAAHLLATIGVFAALALAGCSNRVERFDSYPRYGSDYSRLGGPDTAGRPSPGSSGAAPRRTAGAADGDRHAGLARAVTVAQGDTLDAIARRHGVGKKALRDANRLDSDRLAVGQTLLIPAR